MLMPFHCLLVSSSALFFCTDLQVLNNILYILYNIRAPRCRWEDNIKMDLQEVGGGHGDWFDLAQEMGRWRVLVNVVMNL